MSEVTEALGEALIRAGELEAAVDAFRAAGHLRHDDPVSTARLLLRQAYVAERVGSFDRMLRLTRKASRTLEGRGGWAPMRLRAAAKVSEAYARQFQGRPEDSLSLARPAIEAAKTSADRKALADALMLQDWALLDLGRIDEAVHSREALEIYESIGDLHGAASASNMLGVVAYFQGRWDEAVADYERMASAKERLGDSVHAATGHMNVGEVRSDQGRIDEAEERFRRARRAYLAAGDTLGVAYCSGLFGPRAEARAGRTDEARARLEQARDTFAELHADRELSQSEAWIVECDLLAGRWHDAASGAERSLAQTGASRTRRCCSACARRRSRSSVGSTRRGPRSTEPWRSPRRKARTSSGRWSCRRSPAPGPMTTSRRRDRPRRRSCSSGSASSRSPSRSCERSASRDPWVAGPEEILGHDHHPVDSEHARLPGETPELAGRGCRSRVTPEQRRLATWGLRRVVDERLSRQCSPSGGAGSASHVTVIVKFAPA